MIVEGSVNMKKILLSLLTLLVFSFTVVDAEVTRTYTKNDVEESLSKILDSYHSEAPEGTKFVYESTATETVIKSTLLGNTYTTRFVYDNGIYHFTSIFADAKISTKEDIVNLTFENFNLSCLMFAIDNMYDDETVQSVAGVQVGDAKNHIERFTLADDGMEAVIISIGNPLAIADESYSIGFIKTLDFNLNHPNFIKWVTDNDGFLELGTSIKKAMVDFEAIINDGKPVPEGTPREDVPIKIIEKYEDGTTIERESTMGKIEEELGYKVDDFYTDTAGNFIASVTKKEPSEMDLGTKKSSYAISPKKVIVDDGSQKPGTTENPPTGVVTHTAFVLFVIMVSTFGISIVRKKKIFSRF